MIEQIQAISLWQPWASAVALGWKTNETRHWATAYRGWIAVHAAKRWCLECRSMHQGQFIANGFPAEIPFGAIVAIARIDAIVATGEALKGISVKEEAWGNYGPGRYAWILKEVTALREPLVMRGRQGFWKLNDEDRRAVLELVP